MSAPEQKLWKRVKAAFDRHHNAHVVRVENTLGVGTPDVNYCINSCEGWIELKAMAKAPHDKDLPFKVPHLTQQQVIWLHKRANCGGEVWLLTLFGGFYLLTHGKDVARLQNGCDATFKDWMRDSIGFTNSKNLICALQHLPVEN